MMVVVVLLLLLLLLLTYIPVSGNRSVTARNIRYTDL